MLNSAAHKQGDLSLNYYINYYNHMRPKHIIFPKKKNQNKGESFENLQDS